MFLKKEKRYCQLVLSLLLIFCISATSYAATFEDLNEPEMFFKQHTDYTCTLASATMMIKRAARALGKKNWEEITEEKVSSSAWLEYEGLLWEFSYDGIAVRHASLPGGSANRDYLKAYLRDHPEGIEIYDEGRPHAILITDYTDGVFYAADPWPYEIPGGRIEASDAWINLETAYACWYIDSPAVTIEKEPPLLLVQESEDLPVPEEKPPFTWYNCFIFPDQEI